MWTANTRSNSIFHTAVLPALLGTLAMTMVAGCEVGEPGDEGFEDDTDLVEYGYGRRGKPPAYTVDVTASPNPAEAWSGEIYVVTGTGFPPGSPVNFALGGSATFAVADEDGVASSPWQAWTPGSYTIYAKGWDYKRNTYFVAGEVTVDVIEL